MMSKVPLYSRAHEPGGQTSIGRADPMVCFYEPSCSMAVIVRTLRLCDPDSMLAGVFPTWIRTESHFSVARRRRDAARDAASDPVSCPLSSRTRSGAVAGVVGN